MTVRNVVLVCLALVAEVAFGRHASPLWQQDLPPNSQSAVITATGVLRGPGASDPLFGVALQCKDSGDAIFASYSRYGAEAIARASRVSLETNFAATTVAMCWTTFNFSGAGEWGCFRPAFGAAGPTGTVDVWREPVVSTTSDSVPALYAAGDSSVVRHRTAWLHMFRQNASCLSVALVDSSSIDGAGASEYQVLSFPVQTQFYGVCRPAPQGNASSMPVCSVAVSRAFPDGPQWELASVALQSSDGTAPVVTLMPAPFASSDFVAMVTLRNGSDALVTTNPTSLGRSVAGSGRWLVVRLGAGVALGLCHNRWLFRSTTAERFRVEILDLVEMELFAEKKMRHMDLRTDSVGERLVRVWCDVGLGPNHVAIEQRSANGNNLYSIEIDTTYSPPIVLPTSAILCDAGLGLLVVCDGSEVTVYNATSRNVVYTVQGHGTARDRGCEPDCGVAIVPESQTLFVLAGHSLFAYDALHPSYLSDNPESPRTTPHLSATSIPHEITSGAKGSESKGHSDTTSERWVIVMGCVSAACAALVASAGLAFWRRRARLQERRSRGRGEPLMLLRGPAHIENCVEVEIEPSVEDHTEAPTYAGVERAPSRHLKASVLTQYPMKATLGL